MRPRRAFSAGVPVFLLAAAALGVAVVPARAANEYVGENVVVGSVSDSDAVEVVLAGSSDGATAAESLTFEDASNVSANAASVVNAKKIVLNDGVSVTIGGDAHKTVLVEESLAEVLLGVSATFTTATADALDLTTGATLAAGTEVARTAWTHNASDLTIGALSTGDYASVTAAKNLTVSGDATLGAHAQLKSVGAAILVSGNLTTVDANGEIVGNLQIHADTTGTVEGKTATIAGNLTTGDSLFINAVDGITIKGRTTAGASARLNAFEGGIAFGTAGADSVTTFGDDAQLYSGQGVDGGITFSGDAGFGANALLKAGRADNSTVGGITFNDDAAFGSDARLTAVGGAITVKGDTTAGANADFSAGTDIALGTAGGTTTFGNGATLAAGTTRDGDVVVSGNATFGAGATIKAGDGNNSAAGDIIFDGDVTFGAGTQLTAVVRTGDAGQAIGGAVRVSGNLTTADADGEIVGNLKILANSTSTVGGDLTTGDDLYFSSMGGIALNGSVTAGDNAQIFAVTGDFAIGDAADDVTTFGASAKLTSGMTDRGDTIVTGSATFGEGATVKSMNGSVSFAGTASFGAGATISATDDVTATGTLRLAGATISTTSGSIDLSGVVLELSGSGSVTLSASAPDKNVALGGVVGAADDFVPVVEVHSAGEILFADTGAERDVLAALRLHASKIVVGSGANVLIVGGVVDAGGILSEISVESGATLELLGNGDASAAQALKTVSLGEGGTLVVGGADPLGGGVLVARAEADAITNASIAGSLGTVVVAGAGSLLTAKKVGESGTDCVNVTLDGGELVATDADVFVAALNGFGGALTASDGTTKRNVVLAASNGNASDIAVTADTLRVTNFGGDTAVKLSNPDLANVASLIVANADMGTPSRSTLEIAAAAGGTAEEPAPLYWTNLDVSVGENLGASNPANGTLKLTQGTNIAIDGLSVFGEGSELVVEASALTANSVSDDVEGTLTLADGGRLSALTGSLTFKKALGADSAGTIETFETTSYSAGKIIFEAGTGETGALTLSAGVTRDASGVSGAASAVVFKGNSVLGEGSVINARAVGALASGVTDATKADVNFLKTVEAISTTLKTAENFTGAEGEKAALSEVRVCRDGEFFNDGDLTIVGNVYIGNYPSSSGTIRATGDVLIDAPISNVDEPATLSAHGVIQGANVAINIAKLLGGPEITDDLEIVADDGATKGAIALSGETNGEFGFGAILTADRLVVGTTAGEGEAEVSTSVRISVANAGINSAIEINAGDALTIDGDWTLSSGSMTISKADTGAFTLTGALTLSNATLTIAGGEATSFAVGSVALAPRRTNSLVFEVGDYRLGAGGTLQLLSGDASALAGTDVMTLRYTGTADANVERLLSADSAGVWLSEGAAYSFTLSRDGAVVGYGNTLEAYTNSGASVSVESGDVITVYEDGGNAGTIGLSGDATLTLQSDSDAVRKVTGTTQFLSGSSGTLTLKLKNLVFDGADVSGNPVCTFATANANTKLAVEGENVTIQNMIATYGGALYANTGGEIGVTGTTTFTRNKADRGYGGAIYGNQANVVISGTTTFTENKADAGGGAIFVRHGNVTISGTTKFENNVTGIGGGGAIFVDGDGWTVTFSGDGSEATFTGNVTNTEAAIGDLNTPNDVQASAVVIRDAGTYSFDGGIGTGSLTISDGAHVTFKGGAINSADNATISGAGTTVKFENAGEGASNRVSASLSVSDGATVELSGEDVTLNVKNWRDDSTSALTLGAGTTLKLTSDASATFIRSALTLAGDLVAGTLDDEGNLVNGETIVFVRAIANGAGTISAKNVSLNGLSGTTAVSATGTLTLDGETTTTGTLSANTIRVLSAASLTADFSKISVGDTLAVNMDATATLTIDTAGAVVDKLLVDGAVTLTGGNAFSLGNLRGSGTVEKTGAGALTLGASADFAGTLKISEGAAVLGAGQTFGSERSRLEFLSEGKAFTAHDGAAVAGTLALGAGTTLELGGRDAKATVSVGALAAGGSSALPFSVRAQSASAGAATIVHDVYSASEYDVLRVGAGADLSFATALLRAGRGLNVSALADAPDGVTLTLVEGEVARGYGALRLADELALANFALSPDGTTASVGLGANALAAGVFPLETTADQRSVAQAATRAGTASGYGAALNALTNPHDTLAALDALGAGHAAAMMPAQIDGAWNRLRSVMNAAGTGARLGSETELAAWAQYAGSWTDVDSSRERASWTRRMHGAHAGVERAFASGWTAGAALGFEDSEQKSGGAKIEDDALSASLYARRTQDAFTQTAALSFARHDYETRRTVAFPGYAARTRGDTLGFTAALSYEASYAFAVADWAKLSPVASLSAAWNTIEGWTESGADAALRCGDQDALTWLAGVGGRADFEFANPFSAEAKARAGAYALFTAELGERSCGVDAEFADTGAGFTARYDDPSRYALQLGVTASLPLSGNTALFGGVSTELREDETNLNANVGVRFAW